MGPWPKVVAYTKAELVAKIEGWLGDLEISEGPSATPHRVNESLLLHRDINPSNITPVAWTTLPRSLVENLANRVKDAEDALTAQWGQYSNEEAMTGALFSRLNDDFEVGAWRFSFRFIEFSKQVKEPETGTDVAVVLDIALADGRRSFKTIWLQAKRSRYKPSGESSLPRLQDQTEAARKFTEAFYGLVFTTDGVFVTGTSYGEDAHLHTVLEEAMRCRLGDMSIRTLKNSLNRKRVFEISIVQSANGKGAV